MISFETKNIYLVTGATDLRKGIDGYAHIVQDTFHMNPFDGSVYLFCNRDHNKLKALYYDGTGFWLLYKRLEKNTFKWKKDEQNNTLVISEQQYRWLLEGLKIDQRTAFKERHPKYI